MFFFGGEFPQSCKHKMGDQHQQNDFKFQNQKFSFDFLRPAIGSGAKPVLCVLSKCFFLFLGPSVVIF
jgi:hypothetical protein